MGGTCGTYGEEKERKRKRYLVKKPEGNEPLGRPICR